jgi:hypothetical protein
LCSAWFRLHLLEISLPVLSLSLCSFLCLWSEFLPNSKQLSLVFSFIQPVCTFKLKLWQFSCVLFLKGNYFLSALS